MNLSEAVSQVQNLNIKFVLNLFDLEMQLSFLLNLKGDQNCEGERRQEGLPEKETHRDRETERQRDKEINRLNNICRVKKTERE